MKHKWIQRLMLVVLVVVMVLALWLESTEIKAQKQNEDWATFTNAALGFSIDYPPGGEIEYLGETGKSAITVFRRSKTRAFVIVENRNNNAALHDWLDMRDLDLTGEVLVEQPIEIDGFSGIRREMGDQEVHSFSIYLAAGNKFYEFNAIPDTFEDRAILEKMAASFLVTPTDTVVYERILNLHNTDNSPLRACPKTTSYFDN